MEEYAMLMRRLRLAIREASASNSKHALQVAVAIASVVPIVAGTAGLLLGPAMLADDAPDTPDLDGHFWYLSGLWLGIGLAYASAVPGIARRRERFLLLGGIVIGGFLWPPAVYSIDERPLTDDDRRAGHGVAGDAGAHPLAAARCAVNDILTLRNAAAEYRRLSDECVDPGRRDIYLELALVLEIVLRRLGNPSDVAETISLA
jgi:uncharacterized protein DUF4345